MTLSQVKTVVIRFQICIFDILNTAYGARSFNTYKL